MCPNATKARPGPNGPARVHGREWPRVEHAKADRFASDSHAQTMNDLTDLRALRFDVALEASL